MHKYQKAIALVLVCITVIAVLYLLFAIGSVLNRGTTPEECADKVVNDLKFGFRSIEKAAAYGDQIIPLLREKTEGFSKVNGRNFLWIAEVLGSIDSDRAVATAKELVGRRGEHRAQLIGIVALISHGSSTVKIDTNSPEAKSLREDTGRDAVLQGIIALAKTNQQFALHYLYDNLSTPGLGYWDYAYSCEAIKAIAEGGSFDPEEAIRTLRDCMKDTSFYAVSEAFTTLLFLGDKQAIPRAISRIAPEEKDNRKIRALVSGLEKVTGKIYGFDNDAWRSWWSLIENDWSIPQEYVKPKLLPAQATPGGKKESL